MYDELEKQAIPHPNGYSTNLICSPIQVHGVCAYSLYMQFLHRVLFEAQTTYHGKCGEHLTNEPGIVSCGRSQWALSTSTIALTASLHTLWSPQPKLHSQKFQLPELHSATHIVECTK